METPDWWGLADRRLYLCTPDRPDLERFVGDCIDGGVDIVQLREKHLDDRRLAERATLVQRVCADHGVPFILNDRPDLAALLGADGVHVGQDDPSPFVARRVVGEQAVIGLSTHALHEVEAAVGVPSAGPGPDHPTTGAQSTTTPAPVQYLSAGPVTSTPTKPGRPGTGLGYITEAVARSPWPVWITGGVDPTSVGAMAGAGARHFVVVRFLCEAEDPRRHALQLRRAIEEALARSAV
jgi:thiamine-phosphate pyrophosphorylase